MIVNVFTLTLFCRDVRPADSLIESGYSAFAIGQHDANGNGKIDADEHKEYAHERARMRRAEIKELAAQRPKLSRQERLFYQPSHSGVNSGENTRLSSKTGGFIEQAR